MAMVLNRREFQQDGISIVLQRGLLHAAAIALDAVPSVAVSELATRLVQRRTEDGVLGDDAVVGLAFKGTEEHAATDALIDSCCYVAMKDLQIGALANAEGFLDEVEAAVPKALAIATFRRLEPTR